MVKWKDSLEIVMNQPMDARLKALKSGASCEAMPGGIFASSYGYGMTTPRTIIHENAVNTTQTG